MGGRESLWEPLVAPTYTKKHPHKGTFIDIWREWVVPHDHRHENTPGTQEHEPQNTTTRQWGGGRGREGRGWGWAVVPIPIKGMFSNLNTLQCNSNSLPPFPSCSPLQFDILPPTHTNRHDGGFLPPCHVKKRDPIWQGGFLPPCHVDKCESTRQGGLFPPCHVNKRESMCREGSSPPCHIDSRGTCGPNPDRFWHLRNPRVPIPIPNKTHTHEHGYGFRRVWVRVLVELPMGYPWRALGVGGLDRRWTPKTCPQGHVSGIQGGRKGQEYAEHQKHECFWCSAWRGRQGSMLGGREHARHHKHAHNSVFVVFEMRRRRGGHIRHQNRHFYCPPQDLIRSGQNF